MRGSSVAARIARPTCHEHQFKGCRQAAVFLACDHGEAFPQAAPSVPRRPARASRCKGFLELVLAAGAAARPDNRPVGCQTVFPQPRQALSACCGRKARSVGPGFRETSSVRSSDAGRDIVHAEVAFGQEPAPLQRIEDKPLAVHMPHACRSQVIHQFRRLDELLPT